jgi:hypothetical protein
MALGLVACRFDNASNWQGVRDSATEYHTAKGTNNCDRR